MAEPNESANPLSAPTAPVDAPPHLSHASPPNFAERFLVGPQGLRVGWRLLAYLFLAAVLFFIGQLILVSVSHIGLLRLMFLDKAFFVLDVTLPAFFMAHMEGRSFAAYGLSPRGILDRNFWTGALWGIGAITVLIVLLRFVHAYETNGFALHGYRLAKFAVFWVAFFALVALSEEFLLRGYTQFTLSQAVGFWPAAVLLSLAFGGIHLANQGETPSGILGATVIGLFLCLTLRRTGTLWFAVGFHLFWDWGESYVFAVPDSGTITPGHLLRSSLHGAGWITGGTAGPEGGALVFLVIAIVWIAFDRLYPHAKYPNDLT
jgi:membrane protease YdiL (CAAX protease family)